MASYVIDINDGDISLVAVHRILRVCKLHTRWSDGHVNADMERWPSG